MSKSKIICAFCGRPESKNLMIARSGIEGVGICTDCLRTGYTNLCAEEPAGHGKVPAEIRALIRDMQLPKPADLKASLDSYVIGQDRAKKTLAVAVYNHYKRLKAGLENAEDDADGVELEKSNVAFLKSGVISCSCSRTAAPNAMTVGGTSPSAEVPFIESLPPIAATS